MKIIRRIYLINGINIISIYYILPGHRICHSSLFGMSTLSKHSSHALPQSCATLNGFEHCITISFAIVLKFNTILTKHPGF